MKKIILIILSICFIVVGCFISSGSASINDAYKIHEALFVNNSYNRNIRPVWNQSQAVQVHLYMFIKSIQEFDEVNEKFSFIAALRVVWYDYLLQWDSSLYSGINEITVSYDDLWVPELTLSSPSSRSASIGKSTDRVRVKAHGECEWIPAALIESTCSVDVKGYPFDTQTCSASYVSLGYKIHEVNLTAAIPTVSLMGYQPNALWDLIGSKVTTEAIGYGGESEVSFTFFMKRKSAFVVVNIILPIFFLSILNVLVFVLVPESGERMGYCITTLLAIAVYMTIVSDMLPKNSEPMPVISYKLMVDLLISSLIVLVTILNMRMWNREDNETVPKMLKVLYKILSCRKCRNSGKNQIHTDNNNKVEVISINKSTKKNINNDDDDATDNGDDDDITWKRISHMFDMVALVSFTAMSVISCVVYIIVAKLSAN
ncbi:serotonin-gated cation-selective channel [Mactra antiquata]